MSVSIINPYNEPPRFILKSNAALLNPIKVKSVTTYRFMNFVLSHILYNKIPENDTLVFYAAYIRKHVCPNINYQNMDSHLKALLDITMVIREGKKPESVFIKAVKEKEDGDKAIALTVNPALWDLFTGKVVGYCRIEFNAIAKLPSLSFVRFYELLTAYSYRRNPRFIIEIDKLKEILLVKDDCLYSSFRSRFLSAKAAAYFSDLKLCSFKITRTLKSGKKVKAVEIEAVPYRRGGSPKKNEAAIKRITSRQTRLVKSGFNYIEEHGKMLLDHDRDKLEDFIIEKGAQAFRDLCTDKAKLIMFLNTF